MSLLVNEIHFGETVNCKYPLKATVTPNNTVVITGTDNEPDASTVYIEIPADEWIAVVCFVKTQLS